MKKRTPVSTIMTEKVLTLNTTDNLATAEGIFKKNKIRHIPVVENDAIKGMLSYTDLLRISFADAVDEDEDTIETTVYDMFSIEQVMVSNVISVKPDNTIKEVAEILAEKEFHALPVVENDKLVGIVTTTDLIKYLLEQF
ncbi:CBS domain-containing protein [Haloflavibacter putidus]|uniref:CBS domain-containing protein n=1 Tax=Haloflavibacter putidus TaxID=2576776 RepID=A0A508A479_9FLAO|nr:CBS domain-containing protein [Haloflavibacter putidus]TQD40672.1 CBS domain-containing protein [Haloflavibacter putidus]